MNVQESDLLQPTGELALRTVAMPSAANPNGDIFGGWLVSQMDLAGATTATKLAKGRVATVAIESMQFLLPVNIGATISCYSEILKVGRSSMEIRIEVWTCDAVENERRKVTEGIFTFVAIDEYRRTRAVPQD